MSTTDAEVPEPPDGDDSGTESGPAEPGSGAERLNQPWRVFVAVGEVVAAVLLVVAAVRAWDQAIVPIDLPGLPQASHAVTRLLGSWVALAVLAVTVAGLLVLDTLRQIVLAWRVRPRRERPSPVPAAGEA